MTEIREDIAQAGSAGQRFAKSTIGLLVATCRDGINQQNLCERLNALIEIITKQFGADHGYVLLREDKCRPAGAIASCNHISNETIATASGAVIELVSGRNEGIIISDVAQNSQFSLDPELQRFCIKSVICSPIRTDDSLQGVIYCDSRQNLNWDQAQLDLLDFTAIFVGLALYNIQLQKKCEDNRRLAASGQAVLKISHSIKNILQIISGASEVIDYGFRNQEMHRVIRSWSILRPNLDRIRKLTMDMLDYSKERRLEPGPCDFNRVIQEAIASLKTQLTEKKSKLNIKIDPTIPIIELDGERILDMALDLILNAIDAVDDNGGIVNITTKYHPQKNEVEFGVADNGQGISEELMPKIFEPFESDKNKFGTGLGLAIAKQIIDQHRARIEIETARGKGSVFRVFLPAKVIL